MWQTSKKLWIYKFEWNKAIYIKSILDTMYNRYEMKSINEFCIRKISANNLIEHLILEQKAHEQKNCIPTKGNVKMLSTSN